MSYFDACIHKHNGITTPWAAAASGAAAWKGLCSFGAAGAAEKCVKSVPPVVAAAPDVHSPIACGGGRAVV